MFLGRFRACSRVPLAEQRFQNFLQSATAAQNARLNRAHAAFQHLGDFLVTQAFEVAQDYGAAKHFRNFLQRLLHGLLNFVRRELIERGFNELTR